MGISNVQITAVASNKQLDELLGLTVKLSQLLTDISSEYDINNRIEAIANCAILENVVMLEAATFNEIARRYKSNNK